LKLDWIPACAGMTRLREIYKKFTIKSIYKSGLAKHSKFIKTLHWCQACELKYHNFLKIRRVKKRRGEDSTHSTANRGQRRIFGFSGIYAEIYHL